MPYSASDATKKIIILENNVLDDGIGDYSHLKDVLSYATKSLKLIDYRFIPVIRTSDCRLLPKMTTDFHAMGVTQFYRGNYEDFKSNTELDRQLKPVYEQAEQVMEISVGIGNTQQRQYLKPNTVVKQILEHEKVPSLIWRLDAEHHPTLLGSLGLHSKAYGIKIAHTPQIKPSDFYSSLALNDTVFFTQLLKTTISADIHQLTAKNLFAHAYFNEFDYKNGFSHFLGLLCAWQHGKTMDIVVHLSSKKCRPLDHYLRRDRGENTGVNSLLMLFKATAINIDINRIEFFGPDDDAPKIIELNKHKTNVIRVYNAYLSQASYELVLGASYLVGVSGDNTFEQSVAHQVLPFYHSTNWCTKLMTWETIRHLVKTENFGFSKECVKDLITYFSYEAEFSNERFLERFFRIDLDSVKKAWPKIADYLNINKNFYNIFENLVLMPAPPTNEFSKNWSIPMLICDQNHTIAHAAIPPSLSTLSFFEPLRETSQVSANVKAQPSSELDDFTRLVFL